MCGMAAMAAAQLEVDRNSSISTDFTGCIFAYPPPMIALGPRRYEVRIIESSSSLLRSGVALIREAQLGKMSAQPQLHAGVRENRWLYRYRDNRSVRIPAE